MQIPLGLIDQSTATERESALRAAWSVARYEKLRARERAVLEAIRLDLGVSEPVAESVAAEVQAQPARIKAAVPEREAARRLMFHCVVRVAGADGVIADRERSTAERLGGMLGLGPAAVAAELNAYKLVADRPVKLRQRKTEKPAAEADDVSSLLVRLRPGNGESNWFSEPPAGLQPAIIIVTNLVPVFGVYWFDWDVFTLLFLYWLETGVVGVFNVLRMRRAEKNTQSVASAGFFALHYGGFMAGHLLFLTVLFLRPTSFGDFVNALEGRSWTLLAALVSLVFEHWYSYYFDFLRSGEYRKTDASIQFLKPYGRIAAMHVTIIFGGFGAQELGSPRPALLLLVALKTLFDVIAWVVRLPETGALGRIKAAFRSAAIAGLIAVISSALLLGFPSLIIGVVTAWVSHWLAGRQIGGERWAIYGFGSAGIIAVVAAAAAWWHEILGGSDRYREAANATKGIIVAAILALLVAAAAWPAVASYRLVRTEYEAARAKERPAPQAAPTPASNPQPKPSSPP